MDYKIRKASPNDVDKITALYKKLCDCMTELQQQYLDLPNEDLGYHNEEKRDYFRAIIDSSDSIVILVEVQEEVVGFIQATINEKDFDFHLDQYCYIPYYYVEEPYRNFKLLMDIYREAEKWAQDKEIDYICSDVDGGNDISLKVQEKIIGMKPFKIRLMKQLNRRR